MGSQLEGNTMPLTAKGKKIKKAMRKQYGPETGDRVFYASENSGKLEGVARKRAGGRLRKADGACTKGHTKGRIV